MSKSNPAVEQCLNELREGDESALNRMMPLVYDDLRGLAQVVQQKDSHSLNPTALVHEAFARLVNVGAKDYAGRLHFMRVAAMAMRQLLADHARERKALKRGGGGHQVTLRSSDALDQGDEVDIVALDEALETFAKAHPRHAKVVELRFLTGLSVEETAEVLEVSPRTIKADWQMARAWLSRELRRGSE